MISGYLYNKDPEMYGGKQNEYLQFSEGVIEAGVKMIKSAVGSQRDLTNLFLQIMNFFQTERRNIAEKHATDQASLFGVSRTDATLGNYFASTPLVNQYDEYNQIFKGQLQGILSEMTHDNSGFKDKQAFREETVLGRRIKFEVEVLDIPTMLGRIDRVSAANFQEILRINDTLEDIVSNRDLLGRLKREAPEDYKCLSLQVFLTDFLYRFGTELKGNLVFGTLRVEINNKLYAMSKYLSSFSVDGKTDPIQQIVQNSKTLIGHQDTFLIDDTLNDISRIFAEAVGWDSEKDLQGLKDRIALIRFMYSHCTPCVRGDGAIGDWFELALYRYHGFVTSQFNQEKLPCFETLSSISLSRYLTEYGKIITVGKD